MKKLNELDAGNKPYEKCERLGAEALTDQELLAIVLRTGTKEKPVLEVAEDVLNLNPQYDGLVGLIHFDRLEFCSIAGIGRVKAIQLQAIGEIAKRIWTRQKRKNNMTFCSPNAVEEYFKEELRYLDHEVIHVLYLDNQMQLIQDKLISAGTCNRSVVSSREILIEALRSHTVNMVLVHNHPSGNPKPSPEDRQFTITLRQAAELVGINLVDHVIIGDNRYYSFREQEEFSGK